MFLFRNYNSPPPASEETRRRSARVGKYINCRFVRSRKVKCELNQSGHSCLSSLLLQPGRHGPAAPNVLLLISVVDLLSPDGAAQLPLPPLPVRAPEELGQFRAFPPLNIFFVLQEKCFLAGVELKRTASFPRFVPLTRTIFFLLLRSILFFSSFDIQRGAFPFASLSRCRQWPSNATLVRDNLLKEEFSQAKHVITIHVLRLRTRIRE